jgi:hypothetical protein
MKVFPADATIGADIGRLRETMLPRFLLATSASRVFRSLFAFIRVHLRLNPIRDHPGNPW